MQTAPPTNSGMTNEPWVIESMNPVDVAVNTPARLAAKFWIPAIEATCACVGATSAGRLQTLAPLNARLEYDMQKRTRAAVCEGVTAARAISDDSNIPPTMQVFRAAFRLHPFR